MPWLVLWGSPEGRKAFLFGWEGSRRCVPAALQLMGVDSGAKQMRVRLKLPPSCMQGASWAPPTTCCALQIPPIAVSLPTTVELALTFCWILTYSVCSFRLLPFYYFDDFTDQWNSTVPIQLLVLVGWVRLSVGSGGLAVFPSPRFYQKLDI